MSLSQNYNSHETIEQQTIQLLLVLTKQLKAHGLWQKDIPSSKKLSSTLPFCCDTLVFEQWLQFMFIPKIELMISNHQPLPRTIALTPMAEESFKSLGCNGESLIKTLTDIDRLFNSARL